MQVIWKKEFEGEEITENGIEYRNHPVPKKRRSKPYCYLPVKGDPEELFRLRFVVDVNISSLCNVLVDALHGKFLKTQLDKKNYALRFRKWNKLVRVADFHGWIPHGIADHDIVIDTINGRVAVDGENVPLVMVNHNHLYQVIYRHIRAKWEGKGETDFQKITDYLYSKGY